jgi:hypothetical protein
MDAASFFFYTGDMLKFFKYAWFYSKFTILMMVLVLILLMVAELLK